MFYKPSEPHGLKHGPLKAIISPRPIGWISSLDEAGGLNLAPFSFFNAMAENPPMVAMGINGTHSEGGAKDTLHNIEKTKEFVCNMVTYDIRDSMNTTSAMAPRAVDEFELAGLTPTPSELVKPPRVKECAAHLECVYWQTIELPSSDPNHKNNMLLGQVVGIHISDDVITDGMVDMTKYQPLARLGYMDYCYVENTFALNRPG
ncbi:MAG: flavin reductase family protein [Sneathiella sp.]|uniref:flavin reductase family protein n=1 Tax=Sneathiella sp. TaxID=1964365 RepID=UPI0030039F2A